MFEDDKDFDALPFNLIGLANRSRFGHLWMAHEARFNFHRSQTVSTDLDDIVHTPLNAEVAHVIFCCGITGKVHVLDGIPVGFVTIRVAEDGAHLSGPRVAYDQEATSARTHRSAILVNHLSFD